MWLVSLLAQAAAENSKDFELKLDLKKPVEVRAGEMTKQLGELAALPEKRI